MCKMIPAELLSHRCVCYRVRVLPLSNWKRGPKVDVSLPPSLQRMRIHARVNVVAVDVDGRCCIAIAISMSTALLHFFSYSFEVVREQRNRRVDAEISI